MNPTLKQVREALEDIIGHGMAVIQFPHKDKIDFENAIDQCREVLAALDQMPKLPSREEFFEASPCDPACNGILGWAYDYLIKHLEGAK